MTVSHLIPEVAKQVNRPFEEKLMETQSLIAHNIHTHKNPAVAWSGGKDSTLVLWLCLQLKPDIRVIFENTGVEYPETIQFTKYVLDNWHLRLTVMKPKITFWEIVNKFGFSNGKQSKGHGHGSPCCLALKEKPMLQFINNFKIDAMFTGITAVESRQRQMSAQRLGSCYYAKSQGCQKVNPILWWTDDEVWQYHEKMNIPSNAIYHVGGYRKGSERCGCMPCTAYKNWESTVRRLTPKLYSILKLRKDKQYVMEM